MDVTNTPETQSQPEKPEATVPTKRTSRKSIMALSILALAINGTAAVYTLPSFDIPWSSVSTLSDLLSPENLSIPIPKAVTTALKDIQSAQQQQTASLASLQEDRSSLQQNTASVQQNTASLQQNTALLQKDSTVLIGLRQSLTDEQTDIKKISSQLSTLMAKVDTLQNAIAPEITSSIPKGRARNKLSAMAHKKWVRSSKTFGPVSVGGAPLTTVPAQAASTPEG
jgi:uncharacterized coiled-coil protein SlyX